MTEKSYENIAIGKYTFEVALTATKVDIKNAVEELFGVKVKSVNTLRYDGYFVKGGPSTTGDGYYESVVKVLSNILIEITMYR